MLSGNTVPNIEGDVLYSRCNCICLISRINIQQYHLFFIGHRPVDLVIFQLFNFFRLNCCKGKSDSMLESVSDFFMMEQSFSVNLSIIRLLWSNLIRI